MPRTDKADKVDQIIQRFAQELRDAIREQLAVNVTAAVGAVLGGGSTGPGRRGGRRANGTVAASSAGAKPSSRAPGSKRTPEQIAKQADKVFAFIKENPEQRSEQIAEATKVTTGELVLPIKRLLGEKKIKAKGKARGTMYTAVG